MHEAALKVEVVRSDLRLLLLVIRAEEPAMARSAWWRWRALYPLHAIDIQAMKLIPRALDRVRALGIDDPQMQRLEGIERYFWAWTAATLDGADEVGRLLQGYRPIAVKGLAALAHTKMGVRRRPMVDADLVVSPSDHGDAVECLTAAGFQVKAVVGHATVLTKGRLELDLHRQSPVLQDPRFDVLEWRESHTGLSYDVVSRTGCFITTILHGILMSGGARWVLDAEDLIATGYVDWDAVVSYAERRALVLTFLRALGEIGSDTTRAFVRLKESPASYIELIELRNLTTPGDSSGGASHMIRAVRAEHEVVTLEQLAKLEQLIPPPENMEQRA